MTCPPPAAVDPPPSTISETKTPCDTVIPASSLSVLSLLVSSLGGLLLGVFDSAGPCIGVAGGDGEMADCLVSCLVGVLGVLGVATFLVPVGVAGGVHSSGLMPLIILSLMICVTFYTAIRTQSKYRDF